MGFDNDYSVSASDSNDYSLDWSEVEFFLSIVFIILYEFILLNNYLLHSVPLLVNDRLFSSFWNENPNITVEL